MKWLEVSRIRQLTCFSSVVTSFNTGTSKNKTVMTTKKRGNQRFVMIALQHKDSPTIFRMGTISHVKWPHAPSPEPACLERVPQVLWNSPWLIAYALSPVGSAHVLFLLLRIGWGDCSWYYPHSTNYSIWQTAFDLILFHCFSEIPAKMKKKTNCLTKNVGYLETGTFPTVSSIESFTPHDKIFPICCSLHYWRLTFLAVT